MSSRLKTLSLLIVLCFAFISCEDPNGSSVLNSIKGKVVLLNIHNMTEIADASGVTVAIQGTSITATTNAIGDYEMAGVAPGIYVLKFSKPGFVTDVTSDVKYSGLTESGYPISE